jgi:hypothetical protein
MPARLVPIGRDTPLLLTPNLRDWAPAGHLLRFILDTVDAPSTCARSRSTPAAPAADNTRPACCWRCSSAATPPAPSAAAAASRAPATACPRAGSPPTPAPAATRSAPSAAKNQALLTESFVQDLQLAQRLQLLKAGQLTLAAGGAKAQAHASKHSAVSCQRAGEMIAQLDLEAQQLPAKAEHQAQLAQRAARRGRERGGGDAPPERRVVPPVKTTG